MGKPIRVVDFQGKEMPLSHVARELGISPKALRERLDTMPIERALTPGRFNRASGRKSVGRKYEYNGKAYTIQELADLCGVTEAGIRKRLKRYPTVEDAVQGDRIFTDAPRRIWTDEENDYLSEIHKMPGLFEHWNSHAKKVGWQPRTRNAINNQIKKLQSQGLASRRIATDETDGWLTIHALSKLIGIPEQTVARWTANGLRAYRNDITNGRSLSKIHLAEFVEWSMSPHGAECLSKHLHQNRSGLYWVLLQIGNWYSQSAPKVHPNYRVREVKKRFSKTIDTSMTAKL
jgi:hypothetical protein